MARVFGVHKQSLISAKLLTIIKQWTVHKKIKYSIHLHLPGSGQKSNTGM